MPELRSCTGCKHYDGAFYDSDTGYSQSDICNAAATLYEDGNCTEAVAMMFETILFQLSTLNNCPLRQENTK
jgi:hypothetical protein